jgi:hypothetical protein
MIQLHRRRTVGLAACLIAASLTWTGRAADRERGIPADQFGRLHKLINPQPGEAKWATIPWLTDLGEARRKAAAEDKPLFVWRAGGGEVLGRA